MSGGWTPEWARRLLRDAQDVGSDQAQGDVLQEVAEQPEALNRDIIKDARSGMREMDRGPDRDKARADIDRVAKKQAAIRKQTKQALRKSDDVGLNELITGHSQEEPDTESTLRKVFRAVDTAHRVGFRTPLAALSKGSWEEGKKAADTSESFHDSMRKDAAQGGLVASGFEKTKKFVGTPLGGVAGVLGAVGQGAADVLEGNNPLSQEGVARWKKAQDEGQQAGEDFTADLLTDPLNLVGGSASGGKAITNVAGRLLKSAKVAGPASERAMAAIEALTAAKFDPKTFGQVSNILESVGVPAADIARAWGKKGEFLGRSQLAIAGQEVLPKLGLGEYQGGKLAQRVGQGVTGATDIAARGVAAAARKPAPVPSRPLFQALQEGRFLKQNQRGARAAAALFEDQMHQEAKPIFEAAKGISEERLRDIVRFRLDPASVGQMERFAATMTPQEQAFAKNLGSYFNKRGKQLLDAKVLLPEQITFNEHSGAYVPRAFVDPTKERDLLGGLLAARSERRAGKPGILKQRTGDIAMGNKLGADRGIEMNPAEFVASYNKAASKSLALKGAESKFDHFLKSAPGQLSERGIDKSLARSFDQLTEGGDHAVRGLIDSFSAPGDAANAFGHGLVDAIQTAQSWWKSNVTARSVRYHVLNAANDIQQMTYAGMTNPPQWLRAAKRVLDGDPSFTISVGGRRLSGADLLRQAQPLNIGIPDNARLDLAINSGKRSQEALELKEAAGLYDPRFRARSVGGMAGEVLTGRVVDRLGDKVPMNAAFGSKWERQAKMALYLDGLSKGMAPELAAERAFQYLLDYGDKGKGLQIARWFIPFINWMSKAPAMAGRSVVKNPKAVAAWEKLYGAMGQEQKHEDPSYVQSRGSQSITLDPEGLISRTRIALGAPPTPKGEELRVEPRSSAGDALALPAAALSGDLAGVIGSSADPMSKLAYMLKVGRDPGTDIPVSPGKAIAQTAAPMFLAEPQRIALNRLIAEATGEGANARPLGNAGATMSPEEATAQDILGFLGLRNYEVGPQSKAVNVEREYLDKWVPEAEAVPKQKKSEKKQRKYQRDE